MVVRTLRWQRVLVAVAAAGSALVVRPADGDIFSLPKATLLWLCALACLAIAAGRSIHRRRILVPRTPPVVAAGAFLAGLVVTTITSTTPVQSVVGQHAQFAGLAGYAACVVLFLSVVQAHDERTLPGLVLALVGVAVPIVFLGHLQWAGADPIDWEVRHRVVATLGNPNFLAGWIGIVFPLALGVATARALRPAWRLAGAAVSIAIVPLSVGTASEQGPGTVAVAGLAFVGLLAAGGGLPVPRPLRGRNGLLALVGLALLASPFLVRVVDDTLEQGLLERKHFWETAIEVFRDEPIVGTGPDSFHNEFLPRRDPDHAALPNGKNAGAAHDVPLDMFANGGLLLGLPYLAFVGLVGWRLVVAVRRRAAPPWLLAAVGAAWIGYQTQSLVSIDKPALAALHWVLAGAVVALAGGVPAWKVALPGTGASDGRPAPLSTVVAVAAVAVLALVAGWFATQPMRADLQAASGRAAMDRGDLAAARAHFARARELAPWEATYTFDLVVLGNGSGDRRLALEAAEEGFRLEPGDSSYGLVAARMADAAGRHERATRLFDRSLAVDPYGLDLLLAAARSAAAAGEEQRVARLVDRLLAVTDERADVWVGVGQVRTRIGDVAGARRAFREALELDRASDAARQGLRQLAR